MKHSNLLRQTRLPCCQPRPKGFCSFDQASKYGKADVCLSSVISGVRGGGQSFGGIQDHGEWTSG